MDFEGALVDPSPLQLVARTSLYKLHTLFSLLGVTEAYVTDLGRLVGVVGIEEVRAERCKVKRAEGLLGVACTYFSSFFPAQ